MANGIRNELCNSSSTSSRNVRIAGTSVVRFADSMICLSANPSTKVLGYFHVVRFADVNRSYFLGKPPLADSVLPFSMTNSYLHSWTTRPLFDYHRELVASPQNK